MSSLLTLLNDSYEYSIDDVKCKTIEKQLVEWRSRNDRSTFESTGLLEILLTLIDCTLCVIFFNLAIYHFRTSKIKEAHTSLKRSVHCIFNIMKQYHSTKSIKKRKTLTADFDLFLHGTDDNWEWMLCNLSNWLLHEDPKVAEFGTQVLNVIWMQVVCFILNSSTRTCVPNKLVQIYPKPSPPFSIWNNCLLKETTSCCIPIMSHFTCWPSCITCNLTATVVRNVWSSASK